MVKLLANKRILKLALGLPFGIAAGLAVAVNVSGCGWGYYTVHSVRFNGYLTPTRFGQLPRLPNFSRLNENRLFSWEKDIEGYDARYDESEKRENEIDALWDAAAAAELNGQVVAARKHLRQYLDVTRGLVKEDWPGPKDIQSRRNAAFDKVDALTSLEQGSPHQVIQDYLRARSAYDENRSPEEVIKGLITCRSDRNLKDNAAYLEAAVLYRDKNLSAEAFADVAKRYPRSEKREAALFMSAIASMRASRSSVEAKPHEPSVSLRDKEWESARRGFEQLMREYPKGRYYYDAEGWLAHIWLRAGERARALAGYFRMLAGDDELARAEAVVSIAFARHKAPEWEMANVETLIEDEPETALVYAYHEIYNYAVRHRCSPNNYDYDDEKCKPQRYADELRRIAGFATRMMARYPNTVVGGGFVLRVAESQLELDNNAEAARFAKRALTLGIRGDQRAEALWVVGVAEHRLRRYDSARRALETLVNENPNNRYSEGGRRLLAMLLEDSGNLEGALDVYLALDYRYDVAYFIDVLMSPSQLSDFIEKRPSMVNRDQMLYALGIRYLRERRWQEAKAVFQKVTTVGRNADEDYYYRHYNYEARSHVERTNPKERDSDPTIRGVRSQWIDQDLRTANDLETLEREVEFAQGDEAKAEALYQVASYQFERSLLFYNPIAWNGIRHYLLLDLDQSGGFRRAGESQLLFTYMQKHDMAANSLPIFLEVVRRFPNTRAARDALYSAAVCHERLREYNGYWREIYTDGGSAGPRMVTYRDVRAAYPTYRLPRGTVGWEPSTRTVNGGPGWERLPKPKPRPSRWARAAKLANSWANESLKLLNRLLTDFENLLKQGWLTIVAVIEWVAHWLWILAMCGWLWFLWRRANEARCFMAEALAQCAARPFEERGNSHLAVSSNVVSATLNKYLGHDLRDQWLERGRDLSYKLNQLGKQRRGRALIAFYGATHGLFAVLVIRLVLNW